MIDEPIDFEYQKYKMLGYFQKMAQELDDFKLYPHFQQISLHYANFSNLKGKDQYINLVNELEEIDDEILLDMPSEGSFIEYQELTEENLVNWYKDGIREDFAQSEIQQKFNLNNVELICIIGRFYLQ